MRVLILCTHNSARSQMAEALLRVLSGGEVEAASAGTSSSDVQALSPAVGYALLARHVERSSDSRERLKKFRFAPVWGSSITP